MTVGNFLKVAVGFDRRFLFCDYLRFAPSRRANRKIDIGVMRTRNMPSFIARPGITSGRSTSTAASQIGRKPME